MAGRYFEIALNSIPAHGASGRLTTPARKGCRKGMTAWGHGVCGDAAWTWLPSASALRAKESEYD